MRATDIKSCYIGPVISPEQFVAEHFFLYIAKGRIHGYDGHRQYTLHAGEACIVRKNHLGRYNKEKENDAFEKVVIILDEAFLKAFQARHRPVVAMFKSREAFLRVDKNPMVPNFIQSLMPYYDGAGQIDKTFADIKREELLTILLQARPEWSGVFFEYGNPAKINLEAFMNRNYRFNVKLERFAYLTGRSLSAFKRDFQAIFNDTPNHWLTQRRLEEARFLLEKKHQKPSDIYLELGFEDLSHFSFAFKKKFGTAPTVLVKSKGRN